MAQDALPASTSTTTADVANAKNRNLSLSQIAGALSDSSSSVVASVTAIATAVTQKLLGGVVGTSANRLLRTKTVSSGSSAGSVQNSLVACDDSGNLSGIVDLTATGTIACNVLNPTTALAINKGGTANVTAAAAFDALAPTTAQGDLIYRNATVNTKLVAGTSGQFLQTQGAGANPQWADVVTGKATIVAPTSFGAVTNVTITSIPATYAYLVLHIAGASCDTATRALLVQASTDNSTYDSTAANYLGYYANTTPTFFNVGVASLIGGSAVTAATVQDFTVSIFSYQGGFYAYADMTNVTGTNLTGRVSYIGSTSAIDALKILWNGSGNFDAGTYALYGVR